jgi:hypothetical protein
MTKQREMVRLRAVGLDPAQYLIDDTHTGICADELRRCLTSNPATT